MKMATIEGQQNSTSRAGRPCRVCSSRDRQDIERALADGAAVSTISTRWELSRSSVYRHLRMHWSEGMRAALRDDGPFEYNDLIGRILQVADDARLIRIGAIHAGDGRTALLAGDAELRGLTAVASRIGYEDLDILRTIDEARALASMVGDLARQYPRLGERFICELSNRGAQKLADGLVSHSSSAASKQQKEATHD